MMFGKNVLSALMVPSFEYRHSLDGFSVMNFFNKKIVFLNLWGEKILQFLIFEGLNQVFFICVEETLRVQIFELCHCLPKTQLQ